MLFRSRYATLVAGLYGGAARAAISSQVTFEDGRQGTLSALVDIRDIGPPELERAA